MTEGSQIHTSRSRVLPHWDVWCGAKNRVIFIATGFGIMTDIRRIVTVWHEILFHLDHELRVAVSCRPHGHLPDARWNITSHLVLDTVPCHGSEHDKVKYFKTWRLSGKCYSYYPCPIPVMHLPLHMQTPCPSGQYYFWIVWIYVYEFCVSVQTKTTTAMNWTANYISLC